MPGSLLSPVRHILHAVAATIVAESASLDHRGWTELDRVIDDALAIREPSVRRQFVTFLRVLQFLPVVRYGRPLTALNGHQRGAFLESIERSPLLLVRRGFWGVRALVFMGYYTQVEVAAAIGYQASPNGWAARGGTTATVPLAPMLWVEP
jgi:hypothetical protein